MRAFSNSQSRRSALGFSLVEALVAFAIVGIGLLGVAKMQLITVAGRASNEQRDQALALAQEKIECFRAWGEGNPCATSYDQIVSGKDTAKTHGGAVYNRSWSVTKSNAPEYALLQMVVTWDNKEGTAESDTKKTQQVVLETKISNVPMGAMAPTTSVGGGGGGGGGSTSSSSSSTSSSTSPSTSTPGTTSSTTSTTTTTTTTTTTSTTTTVETTVKACWVGAGNPKKLQWNSVPGAQYRIYQCETTNKNDLTACTVPQTVAAQVPSPTMPITATGTTTQFDAADPGHKDTLCYLIVKTGGVTSNTYCIYQKSGDFSYSGEPNCTTP